jgi:hypothetical protein
MMAPIELRARLQSAAGFSLGQVNALLLFGLD